MTTIARSTTDSEAGFALLFYFRSLKNFSRAKRSMWRPMSSKTPTMPSGCNGCCLPLACWPSWAVQRQARREPGWCLPARLVPSPWCWAISESVREVGRGGMGLVYEAEQLSLSRRVALKVLPFAATMDARQLQRFQNEARAAAGLHHTNIVPVHFVGCERGVHYFAMQFIEGRDLASGLTQLRAQARLLVHRSEDRGDGRSPGWPIRCCLPPRPRPPIAGLSTERSTKSREYFREGAWLGIQAVRLLDYCTRWASFIATSSRRTCLWTPRAGCG